MGGNITMKKLFKQVSEFANIAKVHIAPAPIAVHPDIKKLRFDLLYEELLEYKNAYSDLDITNKEHQREVLDALVDLQYVLIGTIQSHGMQNIFEAAFAEVHRSNMTKFPDGKVIMREDGKILKPDTFTPPNLLQFLV